MRTRPRLTYANVVPTAALFFALRGSTYAAFNLPNNGAGELQRSSRTERAAPRRLETAR